MAEFVIGAGQQKSVREVVRLAEAHLLHSEGAPRAIHVRSGPIDVRAERAEFEGPFTHFSIRVRKRDARAKAIRAALDQHGDLCADVSTDGTTGLEAPPAGQESSADTLKAVDRISADLKLPEVWRISGDRYQDEHVSIELLFKAMVQYRASDVHLSPGVRPVFRVDNDTRGSDVVGPLSGTQILHLIEEMAPPEYWEEFVRHKQTSFNFHQVGLGYSRVSAFVKSTAPHCTIRFLPETIPSFEDLQIPRDTMIELANLHRGLVLITGMTGSGKTTTAAAMIDWINAHRAVHILSIENPVEYVHNAKKAIVSQRSLGTDVETFDEAVKGALRHDPDVIVIGEMRDPDTIRSAINAAATGHLVISTLHSNSASEIVNRIVSFFDPIERDLVKLQLRDSLRCVICQRLVPRKGGGRIPALELMLTDTKAIADGIIEGNTDHIRVGMQQTVSHSFLFEQYLFKLYKQGLIELEAARAESTDQSIFDQLRMGTYSVPRLDSIKGGH